MSYSRHCFLDGAAGFVADWWHGHRSVRRCEGGQIDDEHDQFLEFCAKFQEDVGGDDPTLEPLERLFRRHYSPEFWRVQIRLGEQLAARREAVGLTRQQAAKAGDRPVSELQAIERGRYFPSIETIRGLAPVYSPADPTQVYAEWLAGARDAHGELYGAYLASQGLPEDWTGSE